MQCLVLTLKSSKAYRHIQQECMLPLPSESTLRSLLSSSECKFGFNDLWLTSIKEALTGLDKKRYCFWQGNTWASWNRWFWRWFKCKIPKGVADHVLVFMFRPYRAKWVQPFACFASKGAVTGEILFELILKAIFNHCAIVKGVVSDGAQTNKSAYQMFGIDGSFKKERECKNFISHPLSPK